jgi:hypothetical protein
MNAGGPGGGILPDGGTAPGPGSGGLLPDGGIGLGGGILPDGGVDPGPGMNPGGPGMNAGGLGGGILPDGGTAPGPGSGGLLPDGGMGPSGDGGPVGIDPADVQQRFFGAGPTDVFSILAQIDGRISEINQRSQGQSMPCLQQTPVAYTLTPFGQSIPFFAQCVSEESMPSSSAPSFLQFGQQGGVIYLYEIGPAEAVGARLTPSASNPNSYSVEAWLGVGYNNFSFPRMGPPFNSRVLSTWVRRVCRARAFASRRATSPRRRNAPPPRSGCPPSGGWPGPARTARSPRASTARTSCCSMELEPTRSLLGLLPPRREWRSFRPVGPRRMTVESRTIRCLLLA